MIEREKKFLLPAGTTLANAKDFIEQLFGYTSTEDTNYDGFFIVPGTDFVRVRKYLSTQATEITIKRTPAGGTIEAREEINMAVRHSRTAMQFCRSLWGPPASEIYTTAHVIHTAAGASVAVYQVAGDVRVFLEIEADEDVLLNSEHETEIPIAEECAAVIEHHEVQLRLQTDMEQQFLSLFELTRPK